MTGRNGQTVRTQVAAVQNGGMFYDSNKLDALSALLPYMQGVAENIFIVTLDLESTKSPKKFRVWIEFLGARQTVVN